MNAAKDDKERVPVPPAEKAATKTRAASGRRGRPSGRALLPAGSLAAELWDLLPGEYVLRPETPQNRRACARAVALVSKRDASRVYTIRLWLALYPKDHSGRMGVLRIEREF